MVKSKENANDIIRMLSTMSQALTIQEKIMTFVRALLLMDNGKPGKEAPRDPPQKVDQKDRPQEPHLLNVSKRRRGRGKI